MNLNKVTLNPVAAHSVLESGLYPEDEVVARLTEVQEAPIQTLIYATVGSDRSFRVSCGDNFDVRDFDF